MTVWQPLRHVATAKISPVMLHTFLPSPMKMAAAMRRVTIVVACDVSMAALVGAAGGLARPDLEAIAMPGVVSLAMTVAAKRVPARDVCASL